MVKKKKQTTKKINQKQAKINTFWLLIAVAFGVTLFIGTIVRQQVSDAQLEAFHARPYNVVRPSARPTNKPQLLASPSTIKATYNLSTRAVGTGTIAIIIAYDNPNIEKDLAVFNSQFALPACTVANGCFEKVKMATNVPTSADWSIESALDVQWSHAIASSSKILLVEARSDRGTDLLAAVNYARTRRDVVAVSMSWGGNEFSSESSYEAYFTSPYGAQFFAASGDSGNGTSWPAVSANVISVGGTTINRNASGAFVSETAWSGSGGGASQYIREPSRQLTFGVPSANGKRATPDVAYNANPDSGYPVYSSVPYYGSTGWYQVGGTSAGTPQWAAIASASANSVSANKLYTDAKTSNQAYLRDITSGTNGVCGFYCTAASGFDYTTGLGTPLTTRF